MGWKIRRDTGYIQFRLILVANSLKITVKLNIVEKKNKLQYHTFARNIKFFRIVYWIFKRPNDFFYRFINFFVAHMTKHSFLFRWYQTSTVRFDLIAYFQLKNSQLLDPRRDDEGTMTLRNTVRRYGPSPWTPFSFIIISYDCVYTNNANQFECHWINNIHLICDSFFPFRFCSWSGVQKQPIWLDGITLGVLHVGLHQLYGPYEPLD